MDDKQAIVRQMSSRIGDLSPKVMNCEKELMKKVETEETESTAKVQSQTKVVSHVPSPEMSSLTASTVSTGSSLSSVNAHPCDPLSQMSNDEIIEGDEVLPPPLSSLPRTDSASESLDESVQDNGQKRSLPTYPKTTEPESKMKRKERNDYGDGPNNSRKKKPKPSPKTRMLLAEPEDGSVLSPLHAFIRTQIEVFLASESDIAQPAPGRKNPINLNQVGLRCIHCCHLPVRERVKRAVCYPSAVGRVYHSVSDMKFDHFNHCLSLPDDVKAKLVELKEANKSRKRDKKAPKSHSSSSTAQYYHDSACKMGMVGSRCGVFMSEMAPSPELSPLNALAVRQPVVASSLSPLGSTTLPAVPNAAATVAHQQPDLPIVNLQQHGSTLALNHHLQQKLFAQSLGQSATLGPFLFSLMVSNARALAKVQQLQQQQASSVQPSSAPPPPPAQRPKCDHILLASPLDQQNLNPLHCFVRRHVEVFEADREDVITPAPGRKTRVNLHQVGIRCIHCARLPLKDRVKRSVCFPPSVHGVYHAVSNIKCDHFSNCRGLPLQDRAEFAALRDAGRRTVHMGGSKTSTAQYYYESAASLGLVDTEKGIRFRNRVTANDFESSSTPEKNGAKEANTKAEPKAEPIGFSALLIAADVRAAFEKANVV